MKYRTLILVLTIIVTGFAIGVVLAQPPEGVPGTFAEGDFTPTNGSMTTPRFVHTETLLEDGTVLITGGRTITPEGSDMLSSAEIFHPITATFSLIDGPMTAPRSAHTATLLKDGTVLLCGGMSWAWYPPTKVPAILFTEIYDPITSTFISTSQKMKFGRNFHTATLLDNGTVLIAGGVNLGGVNFSKAEIYDSITGSFSAIKSAMTTGREFHTATLLDDGTVLITGGNKFPPGKPPGRVLSSAEIFIP